MMLLKKSWLYTPKQVQAAPKPVSPLLASLPEDRRLAVELVKELYFKWKGPMETLDKAGRAFLGLEALLGGTGFEVEGNIWRRQVRGSVVCLLMTESTLYGVVVPVLCAVIKPIIGLICAMLELKQLRESAHCPMVCLRSLEFWQVMCFSCQSFETWNLFACDSINQTVGTSAILQKVV